MLFLFSITWGSVSGWWLPVCVLAGLLYAWLMYRQPVNIEKHLRYTLFVLRAVVVFILGLLLISPLVKSVNYKPEKPLVLVLQDNSESVAPALSKAEGVKVLDEMQKIKSQLGDDYEVHEFSFDNSLHNGLAKAFNGKQTDISSALKQLNDRFVNRNIGAVVLATDGIYNRGADPQYEAKNIKANIYTIALGDTTPKRDLLIGNISYNKTAFTGNDFMVEVLTEAYQSNSEQLRLTVSESGSTLFSQTVGITGNDFRKVIPVKLSAGKKGLHKFRVSISPVKNELSVQNNTEDIYIDVLDARQKVLLLYQTVHPDIAVMRNAIESNRNYEVKVSSVTDLSTLKLPDYNLIVLFQLSENAFGSLKSFIHKSGVPVWYTIGAQSNVQAINNIQGNVQISAGDAQMQEVFAQPDNAFSAFTLTDSTRQKLTRMPPLLAPFGSYTVSANTSALLKQRIGNVNTTYPLLAFSNANGKRSATLTGEGLWRWKLAEYSTYGNHNAIEELFSQSVQYLTANANRQQFRVYPAKTVFDEGENILLNAELYNDALELVNTPDVKIDIKSQQGKSYNFLFTRKAQSYSLDAGALPSGDYTYSASAKLGARLFNAAGRFTVKQLNLEVRQSTANHRLLNTIAKQSGGVMLQPSQVNQLADIIRKNENIKTVVYEDKRYSDLVDVKWVFVLVLVLLSTEWFLRKREGEV
ncbi:VWA domain-containing protein [Mucilaginibacter limnophilus]|uniref:VWA domain-containing protein n=1 Tax=Mucilaginibacter limnophilus TaxID=1932778 RepID=A0A437MR14_9SPHI|nr:vWA domain-containing protein [Mucilaginibacter limnophilus]RVU00095.1 VWA domain-containing protein [Mucilaginibacter limnophilus]